MTQDHIIKAHEANQRLDHFLIRYWKTLYQKDLSRSSCIKSIQNGSILVNDVPAKASLIIKGGDCIRILDPVHSVATALKPAADLPITVLFQDEALLVIDKPAGITMHPSSFEGECTVANWIVGHYPALAMVGEDARRPGIVHRLDKHTSGICIIARTQNAFDALKKLFKERALEKTYTALVYGHIEPTKGVINTSIARSLTLKKQVSVDASLKVRGKIRSALTEYTLVQRFAQYDLIEAKPKTGRMHQIRVHFASVGHSIVGDALYGTKLTRATDMAAISLSSDRHLLHASRIQFTLFDKAYDFTSPLPEDFTRFLETLKK